jgi:hypothetical protein
MSEIDAVYLRHCQLMIAQGRDPSLPIEPEAEPSNVHSIEAARTLRCIEICRKRGDFRERPL